MNEPTRDEPADAGRDESLTPGEEPLLADAPAGPVDPAGDGQNGLDEPEAPASSTHPADELARAAAASGRPPGGLGAPPIRRRSRAGWFVWLLILGVVVGLGFAYGPRLARRVEELRAQRSCGEYLAPHTLVTYEEQPDKAAALLANAGSYVAVPLTPLGDAAAAEGGPATASAGGEPLVAGHVPPAWRELRRWAFPESPEPPGALLFLHQRQTAAGVRGVVAVEADRAGRRLRVSFIHPGTYTSAPRPITDVTVKPPPREGEIVLSAGRDPFESKLPPADAPTARADLRFFAGRPDPDNWTHFVIPYERGNERGELEMWVSDESTFYYVDRRFTK